MRGFVLGRSRAEPTKTRRVAQDCDPKTYMYMSSGRKDALIGRFSWASTVARNKAAHWKATQQRASPNSSIQREAKPVGKSGNGIARSMI